MNPYTKYHCCDGYNTTSGYVHAAGCPCKPSVVSSQVAPPHLREYSTVLISEFEAIKTENEKLRNDYKKILAWAKRARPYIEFCIDDCKDKLSIGYCDDLDAQVYEAQELLEELPE